MRTIVREHNKSKLEKRVNRMIEQGWSKKSDIIYDDQGYRNGTFTYVCVMEKEGESKHDLFTNPWGHRK